MFKKWWSKHSKPGPSPGQGDPPQGQGVHVLLFWTKEGERYLSHTSEPVTAEELCISAAEAVGITPLCLTLFALCNPMTRCWYSPNHVFNPEECLVLHYCMRFYFHNWHGLNEKEPTVSRYCLRSRTNQRGSPLLDVTSWGYLFAQAKYEFVSEVVQMEDIQSEEELNRFKNESLGMAVLHLSHQAIQTDCTLQELAKKVSFLNCIPRSFSKHLSKVNPLTQIRIHRVFRDFMRTFQQHTVDRGLSAQEIMYKYISTLEHLAPRYGTETFPVTQLELKAEDESSAYSSGTRTEGASKDNFAAPATHEIMVSGTKGIQWRTVTGQKAQANTYLRNDYSRKAKHQSSPTNTNKLTPFCDFPEITHIALSGSTVCISTQGNQCMVVQMNSVLEARSFISLLDGYYRLTADAHHYLCHEVAPPRVVQSVANGLHGPMHDDFVMLKLKKEAVEEGAFLVRWSALEYRCIILAVLNKNKDGVPLSHKKFRIEHRGSKFHLDGWDQEFSSVKELTDKLKSFVLKSGSESFTVKTCCLPRQAELSNLVVVRQGVKHQVNTDTSQIRFHQIKEKEIVQEQNLGRGTRTNIYAGRLRVKGREENDVNFKSNNNNLNDGKGIRVVLKILDQSHKGIALTFFETASLMSQVSHSHLVFVHGVSVRGSENILVEEFVEFGPLDVFLRKNKAFLTPQWKFIVVKQLASALNYLETKRLVHGNVCAKNILLARRGLAPGTTPFIKLSDPGIPLSVLTREERLERIPWIAPECVDNDGPIGNAADQWGFGVTLLEICNDGYLPLSDRTLPRKERFYRQKERFAEPSSQELASFISLCLTYEPVLRPSFRIVLRELSNIMIKNPDISPSETLPDSDPSVFHKRYLKKIRDLGQGHFGEVTLCQYDPANDGTGGCVAVKALKQDNGQPPDCWIKEIEILKSLSHCNIVKYKGCCTEMGGQVLQLIMEYLPLGSLREYLPSRKLGLPQCLMFAQQICEGMDYLHTKRYIHRDLAARNVLVENHSLVKIGDFGLTKYIPEGEIYYRVREDGVSPVYWYAIECLKENKFSFSSDIWSFGVTLYEILTRCDPRQSPPSKFLELKETEGQMTPMILIKLLERQLRLPCPKGCPTEVNVLMEQCWSAEPAHRPTFKCLIERFEAICRTYDWQPEGNFSLPHNC